MEWKLITEELPPFNKRVVFSDNKDIVIGYLDTITESQEGKVFKFHIELYTRQDMYNFKNGTVVYSKDEFTPVKWMLIPE